MEGEENVHTEKAMAINLLCGFTEPIDITSNKKDLSLGFWETPLKCTGKITLLFVYFLILKKQYNSKTKAKCMWLGMTGWEGDKVCLNFQASLPLREQGVLHDICNMEAVWRIG